MSKNEELLLKDLVVAEWMKTASGPSTIDMSNALAGIKNFYRSDKMECPVVILAGSPYGAERLANKIDVVRADPQDYTSFSTIVDTDGDTWYEIRPGFYAIQGSSYKVEDLPSSNNSTYVFGYYAGLGSSVSWTCFFDFYERFTKCNYGSVLWPHWKQILRAGVWDSLAFDTAIIVIPRVKETHVDENNRLHNLKGPSTLWVDGEKTYHVRGLVVKEDWVINADTLLTASFILSEENVELRRAMLEIVGFDKFFSSANANEIDSDFDEEGMPRILYELPMEDEENYVGLKVKCPSTGKEHFLRTPPDIRTCKEACAWTFSTPVDIYSPEVSA